MRSLRTAGGAVILTLALSACGNNTKQMLGLEREPPDEFAVVSRAPLSVPPEFSLRPPEPGAPRPQEGPRQRSGAPRPDRDGDAGGVPPRRLSPGESTLLARTGAANVPEDIRATIDRESDVLASESQAFTDRLVFWRDAPEPGSVVDPEAENRRIRENQALGEPVTTGETPRIERKEQAIFEGLF